MWFSAPLFRHVPAGLIVKRTDIDAFKPWLEGDGRVSLQAMLSNSSFRIAMVPGRFNGEAVDGLLQKYPSHIVPGTATKPVAGLLQMLVRGRVDAVLITPITLPFHERTQQVPPNALTFMPLVEQPNLATGYIACARTESGAVLIEKLNAISWLSPMCIARFKARMSLGSR